MDKGGKEIIQASIDSGAFNKFILSDIDTLKPDGSFDDGPEDTGIELLFEDIDPKTGKITKEYRRVLSRNQKKRETVLSADFLRKIEDANE